MTRRFRFRYSLRLMLCIMALACLFFASWNHCQHLAIAAVERSTGGTPTVTAPFLLQVTRSDNVTVRCSHHVWCFGAVFHLPIVSEYPETGGFVSGGVRPRISSQSRRVQQVNAQLRIARLRLAESRLRLAESQLRRSETWRRNYVPPASRTFRMPVVPGPVAPPRDSDEREDQSDEIGR